MTGDPATQVAALYQAYQGRVFGLLYHLTGNQADAEDLTQETFLRAFTALGHTETDAQVLAWLRAIARNAARDYLRRRAHFTWLVYDPQRDRRAAGDPLDARVLRAEGVGELRAVLASLAPDHRQVLLLAAAGADVATTARLLGRSPAAIKVLRWRARQAAQRALRAHGYQRT